MIFINGITINDVDDMSPAKYRTGHNTIAR